MFKDFIDFVDSVLPSVDPEARDKAKAAIKQFEIDGNMPEYLLSSVLPELSQGDIISEIPFSFFDESGEQHTFVAKGMVVSTSCHIDQKDTLNIVPVLEIKDHITNANAEKDLKSNRVFDLMYIPEISMEDFFVDFSKINSYKKSLILEGLESNRIRRLFSLSQFGYYVFIVKLTVFFMRKEDDETMEFRQGAYVQ